MDTPFTPTVDVIGNIWGRSYAFQFIKEGRVALRAAMLNGDSTFEWQGRTFRIRRSGSVGLTLKENDETIARAAINRREKCIELNFDSRQQRLERVCQKFGSLIRVNEDENLIGMIGERERFKRAFVANLPDNIPVPVQVFMLYLFVAS
jgi:hypothetical protein